MRVAFTLLRSWSSLAGAASICLCHRLLAPCYLYISQPYLGLQDFPACTGEGWIGNSAVSGGCSMF